MLRMMSIEKLAIMTVNHMNCVIKVHGSRLYIGCCRRRFKKESNMFIETHASHSGNGRNLGTLQLSILQDPASSMVCIGNFSRNISMYFTCEPINKELKMRITYSRLTV